MSGVDTAVVDEDDQGGDQQNAVVVENGKEMIWDLNRSHGR